MLNENSTELNDPPAAQIRVKREEFARAISALEARRQEEATFLEGTVSVEATLRELQIDASAEEVMQQIEVQRAGYVVEKKPRRVWDRDKITDFKIISGIVLIPLLIILLYAMLFHPSAAPNSYPQAGIGFGNTQGLPFPPLMSPGITESLVDEGSFNASSVLKPLSQIPDNQPVHCNTRSLDTLFHSYIYSDKLKKSYDPMHPIGALDPTILAGSNQLFDVRPNLHKPWTLIKHEGRLYLRAWVAAKFTQSQALGRTLLLHSSPRSFDPGVQPVPITLPMSFRADFGPTPLPTFGPSTSPFLSAQQVRLDQHAWEKW